MMSRIVLAMLLVLAVAGCGGRTAPGAPDAPGTAHAPDAPDAVTELLTRNGWKASGPRQESTLQIPADLRLTSMQFPYRIIVDFSRDVGLNLEAYAGKEVRRISVLVDDVRGGRLEAHQRSGKLLAEILLDMNDGHPVGAYFSQVTKEGEYMDGGPGPSLSGRDLEEITRLNWDEYQQKYRAEPPSADVLAVEKVRNALYAYFRSATNHDCQALWTGLAEKVKSANTQQSWCAGYEPVASVKVVEIEGYVKADTPQGFRFLGANEIADQYYVILRVKHKPGQQSTWQEGLNHRLIEMVKESDGEWRLGTQSVAPTI